MAKQLARKEYVLIDLDEKIARRFEIEILKIEYNQFHIISTHANNINSKGRETMVRTNNINEAYRIFDKQIYLKELEGFVNIEKSKRAYEIGLKMVKEEEKKKYYSPQKKKTILDKNKEYKCDLCSQTIPIDSYEDINNWARGGGGWDIDKSFIGYKKVLCKGCQIDHGIYKKSFQKPKKSVKPPTSSEETKKDA